MPNMLVQCGQLLNCLSYLFFDPFFHYAVVPLKRTYVLADWKHHTIAAAAQMVAAPGNAVQLFFEACK